MRDTKHAGELGCQFGSYVFSLLQAISKLYTISKAFLTLKTLLCFDCPVSSQQKIIPHFGVLHYIASFKGAELQFSRSLIGAHVKLLEDPKQMKL